MSSNNDISQNANEISTEIHKLGSAIPLLAFQVCTGLIFGLAIISAFTRSLIRIITRRPVYWDDFFLGVGVICYIAATGLLYKGVYQYYLMSVMVQHLDLALTLSFAEIKDLLDHSLPMAYATACLGWTTIFCVKASFLIISKQLMQRLSGLNVYFWAVATFTGISWVVLVSSSFIQCPHSGLESIQCAGPAYAKILPSINGLDASLDILTDLLVASIPIIILRRSKLDSKQKLMIGPFLSLSFVMIIFAIIRVSNFKSSSGVDVAWLIFWLHLEAGIAVIVTSITTIRTVFTARKARKTQRVSSRLNGFIDSHTKASTKVTANALTEVDKQIQSVQLRDIRQPPALAHIMVHDTWDVSFSSYPHSVDEAPRATNSTTV